MTPYRVELIGGPLDGLRTVMHGTADRKWILEWGNHFAGYYREAPHRLILVSVERTETAARKAVDLYETAAY